MKGPLDDLFRLQISFVDCIKRDQEQLLLPENEDGEGGYKSYNYKTPAYLLTFLYTHEHDANPYYRDSWCADLALKLTDLLAQIFLTPLSEGKAVPSIEWPVPIIIYTLEQLGNYIKKLDCAWGGDSDESFIIYRKFHNKLRDCEEYIPLGELFLNKNDNLATTAGKLLIKLKEDKIIMVKNT